MLSLHRARRSPVFVVIFSSAKIPLRGPSPKPTRCYAQVSDEPSIAHAMYLYSPSVALEDPRQITGSTMNLWQGRFPSSKGAIFWLSGTVSLHFCPLQSFFFQRQQRQWILSIQGARQSIHESASHNDMLCNAMLYLAAMWCYPVKLQYATNAPVPIQTHTIYYTVGIWTIVPSNRQTCFGREFAKRMTRAGLMHHS